MKRLLGLIVTIGSCLMVVVGAVGALHDTGLFVRPPEAVAEGFVRQLVAGRYERAQDYLDGAMKAELDENDLRHFALFLKMRSGDIVDVHGLPRWVNGRKAEASAVMKTAVSGEWSLTLKMIRRQGEWSIAGFGSIERTNV